MNQPTIPPTTSAYPFGPTPSPAPSPWDALAAWATPPTNIADIDKRISDLKTVQFWLEHNSRTLAGAIQALEVQKLTLLNLQSMQTQWQDLSHTLAQSWGNAASTSAPNTPSPTSADTPQPPSTPSPTSTDPALLWWNTLAQQFQHIAAQVPAPMPPAHAAPTSPTPPPNNSEKT